MKISVYGLGYVGCVTMACLAQAGHEIWGVDVDRDKVEMINTGRSPIVEKGLDEMILAGRKRGALQATTDPYEAVLNSEITLVCVGTPSNGNGSLNLEWIKAVSQQIGEALARKSTYHCVVFRSTVLPGTVRNTLIPILSRASKKSVHDAFDVCFNPEFLREGCSIADFYYPPFTVIGQETSRGGDMVACLYEGIHAAIERTTYEIAEMLKYACNGFHALKVAFANEVGALCKGLGIDSHRVMELFALDKKLNISAAYLKPGAAFGGSCLPKDLRALLYMAKEIDLHVPMLTAILESNRLHIQRTIDWIVRTNKKRVGLLGLSFKSGTDDLRESPIVVLAEALIGKGYQVRIYDSEVSLTMLFGANKAFIEREIPHISSLLCVNIEEVIQESELVVICKPEQAFKSALEPYLRKKIIFDLVRLTADISHLPENYQGICW
jgi:GDP-mannose 6-dehydrogenase